MKMIIILLFFLFFTIARPYIFHSDEIKLNLWTIQQSKLIPTTLACSCQLVVFPVCTDTFKIQINHFPKSCYIDLHLQVYNRTFRLEPTNQSYTEQIVNISNYDISQSEITQKITVSFYATDAFNNSRKIKDDQIRKVYLIMRGEDRQYTYNLELPKMAMICTQLCAFIVLLVLCQNIKYRRFTPCKFGFPFAIFYTIFLLATVLIEGYIQNDLQITFWIVMVFTFVAMTGYLTDILSICIDNTTLIVTFAIIISIMITITDVIVLPDAWFINNLIAILVSGALIKFIVIKKLKSSILPLTFLWLFFILRQFAISFHIQNFMQAMQIKIVPLFFQIPTIFSDDPDGYICSAFGTSKIITIGLLLNYGVRIDLFISSNFYKIVISAIAGLCLTLEIIISFLFDELPVMEYISVILFLPVTCLAILLLASKRGQWAEIWHGSFHDMAVDRISVRKQSQEIDEHLIDKYLQTLKVNPSVLSN